MQYQVTCEIGLYCFAWDKIYSKQDFHTCYVYNVPHICSIYSINA